MDLFNRLLQKYRASFLNALVEAAQENDLSTRAASLAMFSAMSVFPFIAILVWLTTLAGNYETAHFWSDRFALFLPPDFADLIRDEIDIRIERRIEGSFLAVSFHIALLLLSAGGAIRSFLFSLREIGKAEDAIEIHQIVLRSFVFIIPAVIFVFLAAALVGIVSFLSLRVTALFGSSWLAMPMIWLIMTAVLVIVLNGIYASSLIGHQVLKIHGWVGALTAAASIALVTILLSFYNNLNPANRDWYGAQGFIIIVLIWFYACSGCILLGAQINALRSQRSG